MLATWWAEQSQRQLHDRSELSAVTVVIQPIPAVIPVHVDAGQGFPTLNVTHFVKFHLTEVWPLD